MSVSASKLTIVISADSRAAEQGLQRAQGAVRNLGTFIENAAASAIGMTVAFASLNALGGLFNAAKEATIGYNSTLEQTGIAFQTMLGSAQAAQEYLFQLQKFANATPFEFLDVARAAQRFIAMGFAAKDVLPLLTAVGNAAAALGSGAEGVDRISLALGQMQARTKVSAQDMMQLTEAGIPAWQILANAMHMTVAQVEDLSQKGQIASSVFIDAFEKFSAQNWGGMMDKQSHTFAGAISTIKDSLNTVASTAFRPLFDRISQLADRIGTFVQSDEFLQWGAKVGAIVEVTIEALGVLAQAFGESMSAIVDVVVTAGQIVYEALSYLNPFARHSPSLVESVNAGIDVIVNKFRELTQVESPLKVAHDAVEALGAAAQTGLAHLDALTNAANDKTLSVFGGAVPAAFHAAQQAMGALQDQLTSLQAQIDSENGVLGGIKTALDAASQAVTDEERKIRSLENQMRSYDSAVAAAQATVTHFQDAVNAAKAEVDSITQSIADATNQINNFANTPIEGTKAFDDQLFNINQKINQAQLQLDNLKLTGAPQDQINAVSNSIQNLQLQADKTRLQKSLALDPLKKQIDDLAHPANELPFQTIVDGIKQQQASLVGLQAKLGPATAAWQAQTNALNQAEAALKATQAARDAFKASIDAENGVLQTLQDHQQAIQDQYDAEQKKITALQTSYDGLKKQYDTYQKAIDNVLQSAQKQVSINQQAAAAAKGAASAAGAAGSAISDVKDKLAGLNLDDAKKSLDDYKKAFDENVATLKGKFMPAIENLKTDADQLHSSLENVRATMRQWGDDMKSTFKDIGDRARGTVDTIKQFLGDHLTTVLVGFAAGVSTIVVPAFLAWAIAAGTAAVATIAALAPVIGVALVVGAVAAGIYEAWSTNFLGIRDIVGSIVGFIQSNWPLVQQTVETVMHAVGDVIDTVIGAVAPFIQGEINQVVNWWINNFPLIQAATKNVMDAIQLAISLALDVIKAGIQINLAIFQWLWQTFGDTVERIVTTAWDVLKIIIDTGIHSVLDIITIVMDILTGNWEGAWKTLGDLLQTQWNSFANIVKLGVDLIIGYLNDFIRAWNALEFKIPGFNVDIPATPLSPAQHISWPGVDIQTPDIATIPVLDTGGLVMKPTLAALAQNSVPEAVVPLREGSIIDYGKLASAVATELANQPIAINVDGQALATATRNALLRQKARMPLLGLA